MIPLIISCIAIVISIIALIVALRKKKEPIKFIVNDDLTELKGFKVECKGFEMPIPTIEDRNKQIKWHIKNDFEAHESDESKSEYAAGFKMCWSWLKEKKVI